MDEYFDGATYDPELDLTRLSSQLQRVKHVLWDQKWHTLEELSARCRGSEAGVSARIRDLRKPRFGAYDVQGVRASGGLWEYKLTLPDKAELQAVDSKGQYDLFSQAGDSRTCG